jgi:hypothetical protein
MYQHPAYVDISHFRAPYKNAFFGQAPPPPPSPPPTEPLAPPADLSATLFDKKNGTYYWKPGAREAAMGTLNNMRFIFIGGPTERVQVVPYSPEEMAAMQTDPALGPQLRALSAANWVAEKLKERKVVFAPSWLFAPIAERELAAIPASDGDRVKEAASTPMVAILAEPEKSLLATLAVPLAIGAVVVVGGAVLLARRKKSPAAGRPFV